MTTIAALPDPVAVEALGRDLCTPIEDAVVTVSALDSRWATLTTCYDAPEAAAVHAALAPAVAFAEELGQAARSARDALASYAATLTDLGARRRELVQRRSTVEAMPVADPAALGDRLRLDADVVAWESEVHEADEQCARALRALCEQIGAPWTGVAGALGEPYSDLALGTGAALLDNYRRYVVPPLAPLPSPVLATPVRPGVFQLSPMVQRPSGLWVPGRALPGQGLLLPQGPSGVVLPDVPPGWQRSGSGLLLPGTPPGGLAVETAPPGWYVRPSGIIEPEWRQPQLVAPPTWMKWGGRSLSVVGAGIGYWSAYAEEYEEDLVEHPEWDDGDRVQSAAVSSAVVGTTGLLGGAGGAVAGAAAGAAIGSVVPGVGTAIGAVVGGIIGGAAGGVAASTVADLAHDYVEKQ